MGDEGLNATDEAADVVARLRRRMIDHCLPLWSTEGWDDKAGGFIERLDQDGRADRLAPRRVRVQARQIYCYAKAAQMGWYADGREIALKHGEAIANPMLVPDAHAGVVKRVSAPYEGQCAEIVQRLHFAGDHLRYCANIGTIRRVLRQ